MEVLKKQAANNQAEYDRVSKENQKLQVHLTINININIKFALQQELYELQGKDVDKKDQ